MTGYPLFPGESDIHTLYYIMKTLGDSLTEQQRSAFNGNSLFHGVKLPEVRDLESLEMKYPSFDKATIDFIKKCLELDPTRRQTCEDLMGHAYFDEIRATFEKELRDAVRKDDADFHFKALRPPRNKPGAESGVDNSDDPVKGWHTSRDQPYKPAKPSFGQ